MKSALGNGSRSLEKVDLALHPCNNGVSINTEKFVFENTIIQADFLLMFNVWTVDEIVFFFLSYLSMNPPVMEKRDEFGGFPGVFQSIFKSCMQYNDVNAVLYAA